MRKVTALCCVCDQLMSPTCDNGALMFYPCLFYPSDNVWRSRRADAPGCPHFSIDFTPSWITQQISVEKCTHRGASAHREHQTMFKIVTWTKQTRIIHQFTVITAGFFKIMIVLYIWNQLKKKSLKFDDIYYEQKNL